MIFVHSNHFSNYFGGVGCWAERPYRWRYRWLHDLIYFHLIGTWRRPTRMGRSLIFGSFFALKTVNSLPFVRKIEAKQQILCYWNAIHPKGFFHSVFSIGHSVLFHYYAYDIVQWICTKFQATVSPEFERKKRRHLNHGPSFEIVHRSKNKKIQTNRPAVKSREKKLNLNPMKKA